MSTFPFRVENISLIDAPLLKNVFWQYMDLTSLNSELETIIETGIYEHFLELPAMPMYSPSIQMLLHVRNITNKDVLFEFKRIKLCECEMRETRVGINTYKKLYNCPHREAIKVNIPKSQILGVRAKGMAYIPLTVSYSNMMGEFMLRYMWSTSNGSILFLNFKMSIIGFEPVKCVLTKTLYPVSMREFACFIQPIWIFNFYNEPLCFEFLSEEMDLTIVTPYMQLSRKSIAPLLVKYRPTKPRAELHITLKFGGMMMPFVVKGIGYLKKSEENQLSCPIGDGVCFETPVFEITRCGEDRKAVMVNNHENECVDFKWCQYRIPGYFNITINPETVLCEARNSVRCSVHLEAFEENLVFTNIQVPCQIHRPITKSEKIARTELKKVESIDDDRLKQDTFKRNVYLQVDLKVRGLATLQHFTNKQIGEIPEQQESGFNYEILDFGLNVLERIFYSYIFSEQFDKFINENKIVI